MPKLHLVHLVALSYHRPRDFTTCINSVLQQLPGHALLTVIDNSTGGLDEQLRQFAGQLRVIRNPTNLGKGRSLHQHLPAILRTGTCDHFVVLDADLAVGPGWYQQLLAAHRGVPRPGIMAPLIVESPRDEFPATLRMHRLSTRSKQTAPGIWYNPNTAGCMMMVDHAFWRRAGGFGRDRLYGGDDGRLCLQAERLGYFVGFTERVRVRHLNSDSSPGYRRWKARNITGGPAVGYWDTTV